MGTLNLLIRPRISIGLAVLLIQLFLWVNAEWIYGPALAPQMERLMLIFLVMQALVLGAYGMSTAMRETPAPISISRFGITFLLTSLALVAIPMVVLGGLENVRLAFGFGLIQAFVIAFTEENVFRDILPRAGLGDIWSNVLFGVFHVAAFGASIFGMFFMMLLGFVFAMIRTRFGILGAVGAHASWNMKSYGLLDKIFMIPL